MAVPHQPSTAASCPCGSGRAHGDCCGVFHAGKLPPDAEALMRSRYSAYVLEDEAYLLATWHPQTRPTTLALDPDLRWYRLDILDRTAGGPLDTEGEVEFEAYWRSPDERGSQRERSRFVREGGRWYYLDALA